MNERKKKNENRNKLKNIHASIDDDIYIKI